MAFQSEHLWCVQIKVATLIRSARVAECSEAKLPLVFLEAFCNFAFRAGSERMHTSVSS